MKVIVFLNFLDEALVVFEKVDVRFIEVLFL